LIAAVFGVGPALYALFAVTLPFVIKTAAASDPRF
jgi:uncharacterized membrane protein YesL